ncbi:WD40 repeat-containing protein [Tieghemostelium lacteum]|uniref:WD40 repeat-containing protein n=1 Tax=Tieghemostelium lacteum TaxID=361077 RepID=A0A152A9W9_TIELA|nr:WD40 repeat-containing protein [Tieghemostelium lacteum]|eukprot:KYR03018.1 WD40 repeat-containing protein [Tieghemostelium lacteum]
METKNLWKRIETLKGGSIVNIKPIFIDTEQLLIANENNIKIYNVNNLSLPTVIVSIEEDDRILQMVTKRSNNSNVQKIYVSTLQGYIYTFDVKKNILDKIKSTGKNGDCLISLKPNQKLRDLKVNPTNENQLFLLYNDSVEVLSLVRDSNTVSDRKVIYKLSNENSIDKKSKEGLKQFALSPDGKLIAVLIGKLQIILIDTSGQSQLQRPFVSEFQISIMCFMPKIHTQKDNDNVLVFGNAIGRINYVSISIQLPIDQLKITNYVHWHKGIINAMEYAQDGSSLYTGGFENTVLISQNSIRKKDFVSGLEGVIKHISLDYENKRAAVCLDTNAIAIVNLSNKLILKLLRYIQPQTSTSQLLPDPRSQLMVNSSTGNIQFFNYQNNSVQKEITVVPPLNSMLSTEVTKSLSKRQKKGILVDQSIVQCFSLHPTLPLLATFESGPIHAIVPTQHLKFWQYTDTGYQCLFSIAQPHYTQITAMAFHPSLPTLLTQSKNDFKLWSQEKDRKIGGQQHANKVYWTCAYQGSYKNLDCSSTPCFSPDGSVFTVSFQHVSVVWSLQEFHLLQVFTSLRQNTVVQFQSIIKSQSRYQMLLLYSDHSSAIWDIESNSLVTVANLHILHAAVDQDQYCYLIKSDNGERLLIYNTETHKLVHQIDLSSSWSTREMIFDRSRVILRNFENLMIGYEIVNSESAQTQPIPTTLQLTKKQQKQQQQKVQKDKKRTLADLQRDEMQEDADQTAPSTSSSTVINTQSAITSLFSGASHIIPSVGSLFNKFMDSMLTTKSNQTSDNVNQNKDLSQSPDLHQKEKEKDSKTKKIKLDNSENKDNNRFSNMSEFFENL